MSPPKKHRTVLLHLYRSLLRLGSKFDGSPVAKAMIYIKIPVAPTVMNNVSAQYYVEVLEEFLRKKQFYHPLISSSPSDSHEDDKSSIQSLIKKHFRIQEHIASTTFRIDTGFSILRKLANIWHTHQIVEEQEQQQLEQGGANRDLSSSSSSSSVAACVGTEPSGSSSRRRSSDDDDETAAPSFLDLSGALKRKVAVEMTNELGKGVILVSHPLLNGPLYRSVILMLEHGENGSYGVVINKPTSHTVKGAVVNLPTELLKRFGDAPVLFGGPVRRMQYLHSMPSCGGSTVPYCSRPMFAGGSITKALSLVRRNKQLGSNFKFFVGCCTWEANQLQDEIDRGVWLTLKAPSDELVSLVMSHQQNKQQSQETHVDASSSSSSKVTDQQKQGDIDVPESPLKKMVAKFIETERSGTGTGSSEQQKDPTAAALKEAASSFQKQLQYSQRFKTEPELLNKTLRGEDLWQVLMNSLGPSYDCFAKMKKTTSFLSVESADWR